MSDKPDKTGNVQRDIGNNVGNIALIKQIVSPSGVALTDLNKVEVVDVDIAVPDPWHPITSFANGWGNFSYPDDILKVMKHPDGQVELRGHIGFGALGVVAFTLPTGYQPSSTVSFACGDFTPNYRSTISIDAFGLAYIAYGNDPFVQCVWLAADSRPHPLSCFPIYIKTKLREPPAGVFVIKTDLGESKRSPFIVPGAAPNHCDWGFVKKADGCYIVINNLTGLPYSQKTKVRFMIVGE